MTLTEDQKREIETEYNTWVEYQYTGKDKTERQKMAQFFTPPALTIRMLEKFESLSGNVLDPTSGAGGLLVAAIIAGANPHKCYGIELDPDIAELSRKRLAKFGVPASHIKVADALIPESYDFPDDTSEKAIVFDISKDGNLKFGLVRYGETEVSKSKTIKILDTNTKQFNLKNLECIRTAFNTLAAKGCWFISKSASKRLKSFSKALDKQFDFIPKWICISCPFEDVVFAYEKFSNFFEIKRSLEI